MKILVSAGGTGGGIYPALAVVGAIRKLHPASELHFVGSASGLENNLIHSTAVKFERYDNVQAGPLHGVNPLRALLSLLQLALGTLQAIGLFLRQRPNVVFLTGGWVGLPVALAATLFRIPIVIYVPDIEPGLTLKVLGRFASVITATTPDTGQFFPEKKVIATGYPLREDFPNATRDAGIAHFQLDPNLPTLLVFGGSRGARSINRALLTNVEKLLQQVDLQIIHVSGNLDWEEVKTAHAQLPATVQQRYHVYEYLHEMALAMAAADLVLSRAGASTLGEFPYFSLPAILVPYPHAWRYQKVNADWLVERGAAIRLDDEKLNTELVSTLADLVTDRPRFQAMQQAAQTLSNPAGAANVAQALLKAAK